MVNSIFESSSDISVDKISHSNIIVEKSRLDLTQEEQALEIDSDVISPG